MLMTQTARWNVRDDQPVPEGLTQGAGWLLIEDTREPAAPSFWVRTGTAEDGRVILTGILLADADASLEVTTNALRAIRVPEVVRAIHWRAVGGPPPASVGEVGPTGLARFEGVAQAIENAPQPAPVPPKRGQVVTDEELRAAVEEYSKHRWSPSPIAATAAALHMSRATVQRRLDRAAERGMFDGRPSRTTTTERSTR
ncbi:hypothetical protein GCM10017586_08550 [Microbacterium imperiale]|uniref:Uncharacterized protein n=2 Tax=Microbacterium imperiale TaxID=33884 RepID=A0A9W6HFP6_9MICO|nr:hypothetical protein GCM10017544_08080 [Microbacterium imperiale]GLJ79173.1 hypothetical protein GCM10017586_08550 [Microbacterium imperiale]